MDHEMAVQTQASERYYLNELGETERDAFEDHVAECSACQEYLHDLTTFAANARAIQQNRQVAVPTPEPKPSWLDWLRFRRVPALTLSAVANVLLVGGVAYQMARISGLTSPHFVTQLVASTAERNETRKIQVRQDENSIDVTFDAPQAGAQKYYYELSSGNTMVRSGELQAPLQTRDTLTLSFWTGNLHAGTYTLRLFRAENKSPEVGDITFEKP